MRLHIKDKMVLLAAYMPFLSNGGIFVPTDIKYQIGNEVFLLLNLLKQTEEIPVAGTVVWVTPVHAQGGRIKGAGIQFNDQEGRAKLHIERCLQGYENSDRSTYTM